MASPKPLYIVLSLLIALITVRTLWMGYLFRSEAALEYFKPGGPANADGDLPPDVVVWIVTPTHKDRRRYADLTGIAAGWFRHRHHIRWILIEDAEEIDLGFDAFISQEGFNYTYVAKPNAHKSCKGLTARNWGLRFALETMDTRRRNFLIFADDDNRYASRLLPALVQETKSISAWPVGNIGYGISTPLLDDNGSVYEFFDHYRRRWSLDMAGFGVNLNWMLTIKPADSWRLDKCAAGLQETNWVDLFNVKRSDFVCLEHCTRLLAFHTKTVKYQVWKVKPQDYRHYRKAANLPTLMERYPEYDIRLPEEVGKTEAP